MFAAGYGPPRRVRFVSAAVAQQAGARVGARVTLERPPSDRFVGFADCDPSSQDQTRCVAYAALDALRQIVGQKSVRFDVREIGPFEAFGSTGIMVALVVETPERTLSLIGMCTEPGTDPVRAAALAVLNATNRLLGTG